MVRIAIPQRLKSHNSSKPSSRNSSPARNPLGTLLLKTAVLKVCFWQDIGWDCSDTFDRAAILRQRIRAEPAIRSVFSATVLSALLTEAPVPCCHSGREQTVDPFDQQDSQSRMVSSLRTTCHGASLPSPRSSLLGQGSIRQRLHGGDRHISRGFVYQRQCID